MRREILTTPAVPKRKPNVPPFPKAMDVVLYSKSGDDVVYHNNGRKFMHRVRADEWVRIYGLTKMMFHAFWPEYDRNAPIILEKERKNRANHAKLKQKQRKREAAERRKARSRSKRGRGGTYSDADMVAMQTQPVLDTKTGADLGDLVHMQLVTWAKTRHLGVPLDTTTMIPPWQVHSQQVVDELVRNVGIDVRYGEFLIYDPTVPVATSVDLLGWMPRPTRAALHRYTSVNKEMLHITRQRGNPKTMVVIEVKTGSSYNMNLGNAWMHGETAKELRLINTPLNQAMTQLAISRAIVEWRYISNEPDIRVLGLLVWVNRATGVRSRWLTPTWEEAGRLMLGELRTHMAERGGKAWLKKKTRPQ